MRRALHTPKSCRELRDGLRDLGARPDRVKGSHEIWRFDDGMTLVVVCNHLADAVTIGIRVQFRRLRKLRGDRAGEEPAPTQADGIAVIPSRPER